jgi:hypothetical protein
LFIKCPDLKKKLYSGNLYSREFPVSGQEEAHGERVLERGIRRRCPKSGPGLHEGTFIRPEILRTCMKKQFIIGLIGGFLGLVTALYVILIATSNDMTLSGVQAALFSSLGLMGAAIAKSETRFAGYMLIFSAVFITLSIPIANTLALLYLYLPTVLILGIAGVLCFMEPEGRPADETL